MARRDQWFRVDLSLWQSKHGEEAGALPRGAGRWVFALGDADGLVLPTFVGSYRAAKKEARRQARILDVRVAVLIP